MKSMTIRSKITLWFSALFIVIFTVMFALILAINHYVLQINIEESLKDMVGSNSGEIEFTDDFDSNDVEAGDHYIEYGNGYLEIDDDFIAEKRGIYTVVMNTDGKILYGKPPVKIPVSEDGVVKEQIVDGETYYVYCLKLTQKPFDGLVIQGIVYEDVQETILTKTVNLSLLVLPLLALVTIVGGYLLAGLLLRPIKQIADTAESINDGSDLSQRINLGKGSDDIHQLVYSFNCMMDRLERAFESERQFISDISHELRMPVSTILAQTELTLSKERNPDEYRKDLEIIRRRGEQMKRLINEMIHYSRLEGLDKLPEKESINLSQLVEMISEEQMNDSHHGITLSCNAEPDIVMEGNTDLLIRLLTNLISNAYRYGKKDGMIAVKLYTDDSNIYMSVKDNGIGIGEDEKEKIFGRFYQVDTVRSSKDNSLGLGLAIVREIARLHMAEITVESELDVGSEFTVIFKK